MVKKNFTTQTLWVLAALTIGWFATFGVFQLGSGALALLLPETLGGQLANVFRLGEVQSETVDFESLSPYVVAVAGTNVLPRPSATTVKMVFVGDIMLDRGVRQSVAKNGAGDYSFLFDNVSQLAEADILFGNLEGPLSDQGRDLGGKYSFRMAPEALPVLSQSGFKVLSVANNHAGDFGREAFLDTLNRLSQVGILAAGGGRDRVEAEGVKIIETGGIRFGFLGFSDVGPDWLVATSTTAGILLAKDSNFNEIISRAAGAVDVLTVSFHFGNEYEKSANARQRQLAQTAIDAGAKLVVGHHPHVVQEVEEYQGGLIAYSLGNFIFDQYFSEATMEGLVLEVEIKGREIVSWQTKKIKMDETFKPTLVE